MSVEHGGTTSYGHIWPLVNTFRGHIQLQVSWWCRTSNPKLAGSTAIFRVCEHLINVIVGAWYIYIYVYIHTCMHACIHPYIHKLDRLHKNHNGVIIVGLPHDWFWQSQSIIYCIDLYWISSLYPRLKCCSVIVFELQSSRTMSHDVHIKSHEIPLNSTKSCGIPWNPINSCEISSYIWGFPKIWVPPNHPFEWDFLI